MQASALVLLGDKSVLAANSRIFKALQLTYIEAVVVVVVVVFQLNLFLKDII